ncbi:MAG: DNA methyltransferase [Nitratireductor rhodophyticola]|uniref:Eco57I restriction-modification methylase domain-containing protein n=1 Tax=Nitratireductor rhodophyticola TaxID=2854036 RepID=UPI0032D99D95
MVNLFNPKTLARHLSNPDEIPPDHLVHLERWAELIRSKRILDHTEVQLHSEFKTHIVEGVLGYKGPASGDDFTVASEKAILRGSVDLALGHFSKDKSQIIAPLELKGAKTVDLDAIMPGRAKSPVQQAWEYATGAPGVKWVLVSNYLELRLYGFGEGTQAHERFDLARLTDPIQYARFMLLLSADTLLSGKTLALLKESQREDKDITDALYGDYKTLRNTLIFAIRQQLLDLDPLKAIAAAQTVLDRVLFTAFAEDTGLLPARILERAFEHADPFNPRPIWENFKGLFAAIDKGNSKLDVPPYNGGLFSPDPVVDQLQLPDEVCEGFKNLGAYDFASEVSVTVLGHIFEQSISDVERLQAEARGEDVEPEKKSGTTGRRKRDGVVYTPDYVARFIVDQTVGTHLSGLFAETLRAHGPKGSEPEKYEAIKWRSPKAELKFWEAYRDRLKGLRIVDPACGSGVFLVTAFDFMKAEMTRVNDKIAELKGDKAGMHLGDLFDPDSEILTNNLFGVDVNAESIEIAKLSLWIKTARRGKTLDSLDRNLRVGDSLIEDSNYAYLAHGFTWKEAFPEVFAEGGFDIVLGNPPYVRMELLKALKPYLEKRFEVVSDRADLYAYFFEQGLKLLKPGGRLGYISSSTFFKTGSGKPLRDFLRREATLETVVDFGDLQIFEGVTTYPAILTMRREVPAKGHDIRFWNVEALPQSNFRATFAALSETYPQAGLTSGSWELESPALKALRDKIRKGKPTLKEVYGSPLYGIKTGLNEAFVIDTPTKERLCAEDPKSAELLKPFLEGKDLKRWRAEPRGLWLIYIPKNRIDIEAYPAIRDWLLSFKERLEKRATKQEWFELQQAQEAYSGHFEGKKIVYKDIGDHAPFHLDEVGAYVANTGYFIPSEDLSLLAFLNSKLLWFTYLNVSAQIRGGFVRFFSNHLSEMPVGNFNEETQADLASLAQSCQSAAEERYSLQQKLVRRLPDLAPAGTEAKLSNRLREWWLLPDFAAFRAEVKKCFKADISLSERSDWEDWIARDRAEIARLSAEIAANEKKINEIVYRLFDLTAEEIALLEANI